MKLYELTYLLSPDLSQEEASQFPEKLFTLLQNQGGVLAEMARNSSPRLQKLAHPIKLARTTASVVNQKKESCYLAFINFRAESDKIALITQKLSEEPSIIRFLLANKKERKALPKKKMFASRTSLPKPKSEPKVELKVIEKKLEEILGE